MLATGVPDPERVARVLADVGAAEIMPRFRRLEGGHVREKAPGDLVTIADEHAEAALEAALAALLPGSVFVGEEAAEHDASVLARLDGDAPVWVIDPLDGTHNFAHEKACFATIVALVQDGETRAGWIHDPVNGTTIWAVVGEGAWEAGQRLHVAPAKPVVEMQGSLGWGLRKKMQARRDAGLPGVPAKVGRYGSVGIEYMDLARGILDFAEYAKRLKPWDHAAGVLIHAEAGGYSALIAGAKPYRPHPTLRGNTLLLAPDPGAWKDLHAAFLGR